MEKIPRGSLEMVTKESLIDLFLQLQDNFFTAKEELDKIMAMVTPPKI